jgi:hydroxymethylglutaryl-CoA synthase
MGFCDDREDIYSIALTSVKTFLKQNAIDPTSIGRLEVGTETILDKAKSIKSVLMQLFAPSGNTDIVGVDTMNACYGGTNALFNAVNWVESRSWDGRNALVVAGDIALYAKGSARPTGGAGAVVMLIGPDAPIVFEPGTTRPSRVNKGLIGSHMEHVYDFYKADLTSEYPIVDGHYSVICYTRALDKCYESYNKKFAAKKRLTNGHVNGHVNGHANGQNGLEDEEPKGLDRFGYLAFHAPTCKLVQKSYARLLYNDFLASPSEEQFSSLDDAIKTVDYEKSLSDKNVEKAFMALTKKKFNERVFPGTLAARLVGNTYTASVYSSLASLIAEIPAETLMGQRIGVFSYGSGLAASFFSVKVVGDVSSIAAKLDLRNVIDRRQKVDPQTYEEVHIPADALT